jgi:hypothetical protein
MDSGSSVDAGADVIADSARADVGPADVEADEPSAPTSWCALHAPTYTIDCHDFDESLDASGGFSSHYTTAAGDFSRVTSADYAPGSAPNSLLFSTPTVDTGSTTFDQFNDFLSYHGKLEISFSVKITNYDVNVGLLSLFIVSYQNGDWSEGIYIQGSTTTLVEVVSSVRTIHSVSSIPINTWVHVDLTIDLNAHTQIFTYNNVSALSNNATINPTESSPKLLVQAGLNYIAGPAKPMQIYWDDMLVDTPP